METDFLRARFGKDGPRVHRLGLSASYWPGKRVIHRALDEGMNYFFAYGFDLQMTAVMRDVLRKDRSRCVLATGAYNLICGHLSLRRTLEKRLRQFRTDYLDLFLFLGVFKEEQFPPSVLEELRCLRAEGKVRRIGLSTHDRKLAGRLASEGAVDALMIRYNAAHRGAETEIFPFLEKHDPALVSYTATRWRCLLRRPRGWPRGGRVPDAGMCYRFVLSNPRVDVCMTAPSNLRHFEDNLAAVRRGPLPAEEMEFMRRFGDAVHAERKWFM